MREAHALSRELGREVLIGGTEVLTPETFMGELARLGGGFSGAIARNDEEVDLDCHFSLLPQLLLLPL